MSSSCSGRDRVSSDKMCWKTAARTKHLFRFYLHLSALMCACSAWCHRSNIPFSFLEDAISATTMEINVTTGSVNTSFTLLQAQERWTSHRSLGESAKVDAPPCSLQANEDARLGQTPGNIRGHPCYDPCETGQMDIAVALLPSGSALGEYHEQEDFIDWASSTALAARTVAAIDAFRSWKPAH